MVRVRVGAPVVWETFLECAIMGLGRFRWNTSEGDDPYKDISDTTTITYVDHSSGGSNGGGASPGTSSGASSGTSTSGGSGGGGGGGGDGGGGSTSSTSGGTSKIKASSSVGSGSGNMWTGTTSFQVQSDGATCALPETTRYVLQLNNTGEYVYV